MKAHLDQQKFEFKQKQAQAKQREREQKLRSRKPILLTDTTLTAFSRVAAIAVTPESQIPSREPQTTNHTPSSTTDSARTVLVDAAVPPHIDAESPASETRDLAIELAAASCGS